MCVQHEGNEQAETNESRVSVCLRPQRVGVFRHPSLPSSFFWGGKKKKGEYDNWITSSRDAGLNIYWPALLKKKNCQLHFTQQQPYWHLCKDDSRCTSRLEPTVSPEAALSRGGLRKADLSSHKRSASALAADEPTPPGRIRWPQITFAKSQLKRRLKSISHLIASHKSSRTAHACSPRL